MKTYPTLYALLIFIFSLVTFAAGAQQFSATVSNEIDFSPPSAVKHYGTFMVSLDISDPPMHSGFKFKLHKYKYKNKLFFQDKTLKMVKELSLSENERAYGPFYSSLRLINNKLYFLYFNMTGDDDKGPIQLMAAEIDTAALDLKPAKELLTFSFANTDTRFTFSNIISYLPIEIVEAADKSQILIAFSGEVNNLYFYFILDKDLNLIWKKEGKVSSATKVQMQNAVMDSKGTPYLSLKGMDDDELENGHVIIGSKKGADKDVVVNIPEGKAYQALLTTSSNGDVVNVAGSYKSISYTLHGMFSASLKAGQMNLSQPKLTPFSEELIKELEHDDWGVLKEKKRGICACIEMVPLQLENGELDLAGMFKRMVFTEKHSYLQTGDIIIAHFKNGAATFARIPKYRVSAGSSIGDGFKGVVYGNQSVIFYNDNEKNLQRDIKEDARNSNVYKNVVLVGATISNGQVVKRQVAVDLQNENGLVDPDWINVITPNLFKAPVLKIKGLGGIAKKSKYVTISMK